MAEDEKPSREGRISTNTLTKAVMRGNEALYKKAMEGDTVGDDTLDLTQPHKIPGKLLKNAGKPIFVVGSLALIMSCFLMAVIWHLLEEQASESRRVADALITLKGQIQELIRDEDRYRFQPPPQFYDRRPPPPRRRESD